MGWKRPWLPWRQSGLSHASWLPRKATLLTGRPRPAGIGRTTPELNSRTSTSTTERLQLVHLQQIGYLFLEPAMTHASAERHLRVEFAHASGCGCSIGGASIVWYSH